MEEVIGVDRGPRWGAIWAGLFTVMAVEIVMQLFGVAVGFSIVSPGRGTSEGVNIWMGIWAIISTLSAFFFGGWVASALAPTVARGRVALGVVVWAFAITVVMMLTAAGAISAIRYARQAMEPTGGGGVGLSVAAAWITFGTVLVSLGCAIGGSVLGGRVGRREVIVRRPLPSEPIQEV